MDVEIQTNTKIELLEKLMLDDGYDAVLVAMRTHRGQKLPVKESDSNRVLIGLDFLREGNIGNSFKWLRLESLWHGWD